MFDLQTAVAESFGLKAERGQRASEALMRRYYWAAKAVTQLNQILMLNIEERIVGSESAPMQPHQSTRFLDRGGMLEVDRDELYVDEPAGHPRDLLAVRAAPTASKACRRARCARCTTRAT